MIPHHLSTILTANQILVLEAGKLEELDSPNELLTDYRSYWKFRKVTV